MGEKLKMKNVNVFDFNNLAIRTFFAKDVEATSEEPNYNLWKYLIINSIYLSLFKNDSKEIIIAVDSPISWRKLHWSRYKESRKKKRDTSPANWDRLHKELNILRDEIKEFLPFKIISSEYSEADDIIAIITKNRKNRYTIVSTDEDFLQLCSDDIKIYNPLKQKFIECKDPEMFVIKKSLMGQPKDDIFNIKTPIDWPAGKRKPGFGIKSAEKVINEGYQEWLKKNKLEERFKFNKILIDFNSIPISVKNKILKRYDSYELPNPDKIYSFFKRYKFKSLLDDFTNVENNLLELY